jgi:hypothetical protein
VDSYFTFWCSDHRPWVQAAIFYDAYYWAREYVERDARPSFDSPEESEGDDEDNDS